MLRALLILLNFRCAAPSRCRFGRARSHLPTLVVGIPTFIVGDLHVLFAIRHLVEARLLIKLFKRFYLYYFFLKKPPFD
jgi:hypothetical protein